MLCRLGCKVKGEGGVQHFRVALRLRVKGLRWFTMHMGFRVYCLIRELDSLDGSELPKPQTALGLKLHGSNLPRHGSGAEDG